NYEEPKRSEIQRLLKGKGYTRRGRGCKTISTCRQRRRRPSESLLRYSGGPPAGRRAFTVRPPIPESEFHQSLDIPLNYRAFCAAHTRHINCRNTARAIRESAGQDGSGGVADHGSVLLLSVHAAVGSGRHDAAAVGRVRIERHGRRVDG